MFGPNFFAPRASDFDPFEASEENQKNSCFKLEYSTVIFFQWWAANVDDF